MRGKAQMSVKTKKILLITGIVFGTIFLFVVSFFLSLYFIIHPIKVTAPDNGEVAAENQELKIQVQTLEDQIEHLNAMAEKDKNNVNTPAPPAVVDIPTAVTPTGEDKPTSGDRNSADRGTENDEGKAASEDDDFSPDTVVTPEDGYEPEVEPDITIIDISE